MKVSPLTQFFINSGLMVTSIGLTLILGAGVLTQLVSPWYYNVVFPFLNAAKSNETVIVVTKFHLGEGLPDSEPDKKIIRSLQIACKKFNLKNVRIVHHPEELELDNDDAETLRRKYKAAIVITGEDTGVQQLIQFVNYEQGVMLAVENLDKASLVNSAGYATFTTHELPAISNFLAFFTISQIFAAKNEFSEAIVAAESALNSLPKDMHPPIGKEVIFLNLGTLYARTGNKELAMKAYEEGLTLTSNTEIKAFFLMSQGGLYVRENDYIKAISTYDEAIKLLTDSPLKGTFFFLRGNSFGQIKELEKGIEDLTKAIVLLPDNNPDKAKAFCYRGLFLMDLNKTDAAASDFSNALKFLSEDDLDTRARTLFGFSVVEARKGEHQASLKLVSQAVGILPSKDDRDKFLDFRKRVVSAITRLNPELLILNGGTATEFTEISVEQLVPPGMSENVTLHFAVEDFSEKQDAIAGYIRSTSGAVEKLEKEGVFSQKEFELPLQEKHLIQYKISNPKQKAYIWVTGYRRRSIP